MEGKDQAIEFTREGTEAILAKVIEAEQYEKFLGKKYVGTNRLGLPGRASMIPEHSRAVKSCGPYHVRQITLRTAHPALPTLLPTLIYKTPPDSSPTPPRPAPPTP